MKLGKHCSFFRFEHLNASRFGQKVSCDIIVVETNSENLNKEMSAYDIVKLNPKLRINKQAH